MGSAGWGTAQGEGSQTHMSMVHSNTIRIHNEHRSATHAHNSQEHISAGHSHTMNTVSRGIHEWESEHTTCHTQITTATVTDILYLCNGGQSNKSLCTPSSSGQMVRRNEGGTVGNVVYSGEPAHLLFTPAHLLFPPAQVLFPPAHLLSPQAHLLFPPAHLFLPLQHGNSHIAHQMYQPLKARCHASMDVVGSCDVVGGNTD